MSDYELIRRAMLELGYDEPWLSNPEAFADAVAPVILDDVKKATMSNAVYASVAADALDHARMDFFYPHDAYSMAGLGVDCFLYSESYPEKIAERRYFNQEAPAETPHAMPPSPRAVRSMSSLAGSRPIQAKAVA